MCEDYMDEKVLRKKTGVKKKYLTPKWNWYMMTQVRNDG